MRTVEFDLYAELRKKIGDLEKENEALRLEKADIERRLTELHGEYLLLRYRMKELPNASEYLKLRQEMQALKKELRQRGWKDLM